MRQGSFKIGALGIQHVLAMYAGAVVVPLIVGPSIGMSPVAVNYLISLDLFSCGIATLLQVVGGPWFGIRLPVILGCAFQAVAPMIIIGKAYGITSVYGSIICSGIMVMILSQFMGYIVKLFPPVVTGSVVTVIGLSLISVALDDVGGGVGSPQFGSWENLLLALITLLLILLLNRFMKGTTQALAVLIAIALGTLLAYVMGIGNFAPVSAAGWFRVVQPFHFGLPAFHVTAIISMTLIGIVSMMESTAVFFALGEICERKIEPADLRRGLRAEGLAAFVGAIMNSFPYTTFSQNVGLVALTRVRTRNVTIVAGCFLVIIGFLPKVAGVAQSIPAAVLGGAMIAMFGMVVAAGIRTLRTVDYQRNDNLLIVAVSVSLGVGVTVVPTVFGHLPTSMSVFMQDGIVVGAFSAVLLNLLFNAKRKLDPGVPVSAQALSEVSSAVESVIPTN